MEINFITKPKIFKVGQTQIDYNGLRNFSDFIKDESGKNPEKLDELYRGEQNDVDKMAELAGRVCYQSYFKGRNSLDYIDHIKEDQHGNVFEHPTVNFVITGVSRSLTHELIRHRVGTAISEMSQRFVGANEKSGKWNFVVPAALRDYFDAESEVGRYLLKEANISIESYNNMKYVMETMIHDDEPNRKKKILEAAREVLPNWIETRGVWSVNMRTVRHILDKRGSEHADKQISEFSVELLEVLSQMNTIILNDISHENGTVKVKNQNV